jgi:glutaredoxin
MIIHVYGKDGCRLCHSAEKKLNHFLDRWGVDEEVEIAFLDMENDYHAAAEGDFFDVFDIPTVMVMKDESNVLARWDGHPPHSDELKEIVQANAA